MVVNLSVLSIASFQQLAKLGPRIRVVGTAWEREVVLAEDDGRQRRMLSDTAPRRLTPHA